MLIRLAGRQAAVATTLTLKATLAIQPRLADGNVADGRGIDPRGVFIKDDQVGRFACHDYTGEILAVPSRSAVTIRNAASTGAFSAGFSTSLHGPRDLVLDHPQRANRDDIPVGV